MEIEIHYVCCAKCGIPIILTVDHIRKLRETHAEFFCVNGHAQSFPGKTEAQLYKEKFEQERLDYLALAHEKVKVEAELKRVKREYDKQKSNNKKGN